MKNERVSFIIDIAIPLRINIQKTHTGKFNKYLPLADEIKAVWNMEKVIVAITVIGATGVIVKIISQSLESLQMNKYVCTENYRKQRHYYL